MAHFTIELQEGVQTGRCSGCGSEHRTLRGYVYESGDAFALYDAQLAPEHGPWPVALDIAVGDWDEDAPAERRRRIGLWVRSDSESYRVTVAETQTWPWQDSEVFGRVLPRQEALADPEIDRFYEVADFVVYSDPRIRAYLEGETGGNVTRRP
jgi:hypothetical protein